MCARIFRALLLSALFVSSVDAQTAGQAVVLTVDAPVFASPDTNQTPLRLGRQGSLLRLLETAGEWSRIEYNDPELGRRVGYVQARYLRTATPADSVDAVVPQTTGQRPVLPQPTPTQSPAPGSEQRGDVAIGYVFMHAEDVALPLGIAGSDGWRVHPNIDIVLESQYTHGTIDAVILDLGANVWSLLGGPRFWGGSRYGASTRAFGQVLGGVVATKATLGSLAKTTSVGFGVQPGFGVEVPVARAVAIRPQFDVLIGRVEGVWGWGTRANANVVFRFFR